MPPCTPSRNKASPSGSTYAAFQTLLTETAKLRNWSLVAEQTARGRAQGFTEMQILDYTIRSHVPGVNMDFPSPAGAAAAFLQAGDR
jgi:hypothetical protein